MSDPRIVVDEFPDHLRDAGLEGGNRRSTAKQRAAFADSLDVPLEEVLDAALAAEFAPAPALPGMPRARRRPPSRFPKSDQDQRAIEEVQQTLSTLLFTSHSAVLRGLKFLARVES